MPAKKKAKRPYHRRAKSITAVAVTGNAFDGFMVAPDLDVATGVQSHLAAIVRQWSAVEALAVREQRRIRG